jgi:hypothetical protein
MPVHDWTRVDAGLFHAFHQRWISALCDALNMGVLPKDYFALPEQRIRGPIPDVLTLELSPQTQEPPEDSGGPAVAIAPPRARVTRRIELKLYARKANRITVRHRHGKVIAVIEIVSPGNKETTAQFRAFVQKSADLIEQGVHLLVVDLFPPSRRDPFGIHKAIWDEFEEVDFELPTDKPLVLASYDAGEEEQAAYVETVGVGDVLPDMPIFLRPQFYVPVPLEATYQATWNVFPAALKGLLETPARDQPNQA